MRNRDKQSNDLSPEQRATEREKKNNSDRSELKSKLFSYEIKTTLIIIIEVTETATIKNKK